MEATHQQLDVYLQSNVTLMLGYPLVSVDGNASFIRIAASRRGLAIQTTAGGIVVRVAASNVSVGSVTLDALHVVLAPNSIMLEDQGATMSVGGLNVINGSTVTAVANGTVWSTVGSISSQFPSPVTCIVDRSYVYLDGASRWLRVTGASNDTIRLNHSLSSFTVSLSTSSVWFFTEASLVVGGIVMLLDAQLMLQDRSSLLQVSENVTNLVVLAQRSNLTMSTSSNVIISRNGAGTNISLLFDSSIIALRTISYVLHATGNVTSGLYNATLSLTDCIVTVSQQSGIVYSNFIDSVTVTSLGTRYAISDTSTALLSSMSVTQIELRMEGCDLVLTKESRMVDGIGGLTSSGMTLLQCNVNTEASRLLNTKSIASNVVVMAIESSLRMRSTSLGIFSIGQLSNATMTLQQCDVTMESSRLLCTNSYAFGVAVTAVASSMTLSSESYGVFALGLLSNATMPLMECTAIVNASRLLYTSSSALGVAVIAVATSMRMSTLSYAVYAIGQLSHVTMTIQHCNLMLDDSRLIVTAINALDVAVTVVESSMNLNEMSFGVLAGDYFSSLSITLRHSNVTMSTSRLLNTNNNALDVTVSAVSTSINLSSEATGLFVTGHISNVTLTLEQCNVTMMASRFVNTNSNALSVAVTVVASSMKLSEASSFMFVFGDVGYLTIMLQQVNLTLSASNLLSASNKTSVVAVTAVASAMQLRRTSVCVFANGHLSNVTMSLQRCDVTMDSSGLLVTNNIGSGMAVVAVGSLMHLSSVAFTMFAGSQLIHATVSLQQCKVTVEYSSLMATNGNASFVTVIVIESSMNFTNDSHALVSIGQLSYATMTLQQSNVSLCQSGVLSAWSGIVSAALSIASVMMSLSNASIVNASIVGIHVVVEHSNVECTLGCALMITLAAPTAATRLVIVLQQSYIDLCDTSSIARPMNPSTVGITNQTLIIEFMDVRIDLHTRTVMSAPWLVVGQFDVLVQLSDTWFIIPAMSSMPADVVAQLPTISAGSHSTAMVLIGCETNKVDPGGEGRGVVVPITNRVLLASGASSVSFMSCTSEVTDTATMEVTDSDQTSSVSSSVSADGS